MTVVSGLKNNYSKSKEIRAFIRAIHEELEKMNSSLVI